MNQEIAEPMRVEKKEPQAWALRQAKAWLDAHPTVAWFLDDVTDLANLLVEVAENHQVKKPS